MARSWAQPPELKLRGDDFTSEGYDLTQRAYILKSKDHSLSSALEFELMASEESPVVNPCFFIKGWGDSGVTMKINGKLMEQGTAFRMGKIHKLEGSDLVVWIKKESTKPIMISVIPEEK